MAKARIITVHGTWPRRPWLVGPGHDKDQDMDKRWYFPDSAFLAALKNEPGNEFTEEAFLWSGRNRIADRWIATLRLKRKLRMLAREEGMINIVVAHSHGGYVALGAIGLLPQELRPRGLAVLATPFIRSSERMTSQFFSIAVNWFWFTLSIFIMFAMLFAPLMAWSLWSPEAHDWENLLAFGLGLAMFCATGCLLDAIQMRWSRYRKRALRAIKNGQPLDLPCEVLVVRATGDEASAALELGSLGTKLVTMLRKTSVDSHWFHSLVDRVGKGLYLLYLFAFAIILLYLIILGWFLLFRFDTGSTWLEGAKNFVLLNMGYWMTPVLTILYFGIFVIPIVAFGFWLLEGFSTAVVFGLDSLLVFDVCRLTVEPNPQTGSSQHNLRTPDAIKADDSLALGHSIHERVEARVLVANWVGSLLRKAS